MKCFRLGVSTLLAITSMTGLYGQQTKSSNVEVSTGTAGGTPPPKKHAVSGDVSKSVTSGFKYNPPPPEKPEEELVDMREIDKPRNQIIRLPKYVVEAQKPPVFTDRNLYSKEMLRRLAYRRYVTGLNRSLNSFRLPLIGGGVDAYATMMYEAEERQAAMADMNDKVSMYLISGDKAEAQKQNNDNQDTFMRRSEQGLGTRRSTGQ
ncbi:MAG: hypothetical protein QM790_13435 [Nibricoccus sp.]